MVCCLAAKQLGAKYSIARIRDPEYTESLTMLQNKLDIDQVINPERAAAQEISRLLRLPFAINIEPFAHGRVEMVEFKAEKGDPILARAALEAARQVPKDTVYRRSAQRRSHHSRRQLSNSGGRPRVRHRRSRVDHEVFQADGQRYTAHEIRVAHRRRPHFLLSCKEPQRHGRASSPDRDQRKEVRAPERPVGQRYGHLRRRAPTRKCSIPRASANAAR